MSEISVSARPVYLSFRVKTRRVCFHPKLCILWPNPHSSPCTHSFQSFSLLLLPIFASFAEHQEDGGGRGGGGGVRGGGVVGRVNLLIVKKPLLSLFVLAVSDSDLNYRRFRYTSEQVGMGEEERE